jgi:hypothetical protein
MIHECAKDNNREVDLDQAHFAMEIVAIFAVRGRTLSFRLGRNVLHE